MIRTEAGREAARREYDELTDDERRQIGAEVGELWARCLRLAIRRLWHACITLEIDPTTLNVDHVALYAATMLSESEANKLANS